MLSGMQSIHRFICASTHGRTPQGVLFLLEFQRFQGVKKVLKKEKKVLDIIHPQVYIIYRDKEDKQMTFTIEKVANMIFITSDCGVIFKAWHEAEFTERKLNNQIKKINDNLTGHATFINML